MAEKRIYVDTNVYIDYFEDRSDNLRPLGELAFQLFERALSCEFKIIMSSEVAKELRNNGYFEDINKFTEKFRKANKIEFIKVTDSDKHTASKGKTSHYEDRLHYAIAERSNAEFVVTRNWTDFYGLGKIPVTLPEFI